MAASFRMKISRFSNKAFSLGLVVIRKKRDGSKFGGNWNRHFLYVVFDAIFHDEWIGRSKTDAIM